MQEALQAFRALRRRAGSAPLAMVDDAELAQLLVGARYAAWQCGCARSVLGLAVLRLLHGQQWTET